VIKLLPLLLILLTGCNSVTGMITPQWEWIGVTSTKTHNTFVGEVEEFGKDVVKNQSRVVEITHDLNQEQIYVAKAKDDVAMLERTYITRGKINHAKEVSEELSNREFSKAPDPPFDWSSIIQMALGAMGLGGPLGAIALSQRGKIKDVAKQAIANGESTKKNDTSHLKKLAGV